MFERFSLQHEILSQKRPRALEGEAPIMTCNWLGPLYSTGCFVTHHVFPHKFSGYTGAW